MAKLSDAAYRAGQQRTSSSGSGVGSSRTMAARATASMVHAEDMGRLMSARCFAVIAATALAACSFEQVVDKSVADTVELVMPTLVRIVQGHKLVLTCTWGFASSENSRPETETVDFKQKTVNGFPATIDDDHIQWSIGKSGDSAGSYWFIDRHSGDMRGASWNGWTVDQIRGTCTKDDRKF